MTIAFVIEELDKLPGDHKDPFRQERRNALAGGTLPRCECQRFIQLNRLTENPLVRQCAVCAGKAPVSVHGYRADIPPVSVTGHPQMSARMFFSKMKL